MTKRNGTTTSGIKGPDENPSRLLVGQLQKGGTATLQKTRLQKNKGRGKKRRKDGLETITSRKKKKKYINLNVKVVRRQCFLNWSERDDGKDNVKGSSCAPLTRLRGRKGRAGTDYSHTGRRALSAFRVHPTGKVFSRKNQDIERERAGGRGWRKVRSLKLEKTKQIKRIKEWSKGGRLDSQPALG